jgi:hypothetical protein
MGIESSGARRLDREWIRLKEDWGRWRFDFIFYLFCFLLWIDDVDSTQSRILLHLIQITRFGMWKDPIEFGA